MSTPGATSGSSGDAPVIIDPDEPRFVKGRTPKAAALGLVAAASLAVQSTLTEVWAKRQYGEGVRFVWRPDIKDRIMLTAVFWNQVAKATAEGGEVVVVLGAPEAKPAALESIAALFRGGAGGGARARPQWLQDQLPFTVEAPAEAPAGALVVRVRAGLRPQLPPPAPEAGPEDAIAHTKAWVERVLVGFNVCPFTASADVAAKGLEDIGVTPGSVRYSYTAERYVPALMAHFWAEVVALLIEPEAAVATGLIAAPCLDESWEKYRDLCTFLEEGVRASNAFLDVGLVWFHPLYETLDTLEYGHMHPAPALMEYIERYYPVEAAGLAEGGVSELMGANNYARRTPHATINTLRVNQVALAERKRPGLSKQVYAANARRLVGVGEEVLKDGLEQERRCPLRRAAE